MKISYNWLKQYLNINIETETLSEILTNTGLEVEGIEKFESIKGGLEGVVVGKVVSCEKHPNADKLSKTTVDIGNGEILPIVCGAPNVASGQKVLVATIGTILYSEKDRFEIKKSKIRGEESFGMICAEDELGLGNSHDGIMVLPDNVEIGTLAKNYFSIETDYVFEIGLTPNRIDAASHVGVARDILAALKKDESSVELNLPNVDKIETIENSFPIEIKVENTELCPRYTGLTIEGVMVKESPQWLQNKLKAIGQHPINNVVDITNYVLHELGQPLHAFDINKIDGKQVIVKTADNKQKFTTLDGTERELCDTDLMICNANSPMCIAGVLGGIESGVTNNTTSIFLESAYFNPISIRKTAKHHGINTDASFRFERGIDGNITVFALKRAASLILEIAGGKITSDIFDTNPEGFKPNEITVSFEKINKLIGKKLDKQLIKNILNSLDIEISEEDEYEMSLLVPAYRVDVIRQEDIVEEILRIYGYNNIEIPTSVKSSIVYSEEVDSHKLKNEISDMLVSNGMFEIMCNSLTKGSYHEKITDFETSTIVNMLNPLSIDHNVLRKSLIFGMLESVVHNTNRRNPDVALFEFGASYHKKEAEIAIERYFEKQHLGIIISGEIIPQSWNMSACNSDFFYLKSQVHNVLDKLGFDADSFLCENYKSDIIQGVEYYKNKHSLVRFGIVSNKLQKMFDIDNPVYYAEFDWDTILSLYSNKITFKQLPKMPEVKRDLSLLIDETVSFEEIKQIAYKSEKQLLKNVNIFDVYQGKGIPENKKSYAISFILQDDANTLTDKRIDKTMSNIINSLMKQLGAELR